MDKKYLEALSNFGYALEELAEQLKKKSDKSGKGGGLLASKTFKNVDSTLENISKSISDIKSDTTEIISNQKTILKMGKDNEKSGGLLSGLKEKKSNIGEGVSTIILMSGAIMAIGLAFKVVGGVDFLSVIALSLALPLIAIAFSEIATTIKEKKLTVKDLFFTSFALVLMAGALTVSSWIMSAIAPIGLSQFLTGIGIALTLAVASIGVSFLVDNLRKVKFVDLLKLPIALVAISTAIMLSSYILGKTNEISPSLLMNIALQGIVMGIVSAIVSVPILLFKMFGLKNKDIQDGAISLVFISASIMASSYFLAAGDYSVAPSIGWSIGASASLLAFSIPIIILGKMGASVMKDILFGGIAVLGVSLTIMLASNILAYGDYDTYPGLDWALGTSLAIGSFAIGMVALGFIAMTGIGAVAMLMGAGMVLIVASTIVAVSEVLSNGDFSAGSGMMGWALATTSLFIIFAPIIVTLGLLAITGIGALAIYSGAYMLLMVTNTIVEVSDTLGNADFSQGSGGTSWALATTSLFLAFTPIMIGLGFVAMTGIGALAMLIGAPIMLMIANTIVEVSDILSEGNFSAGSSMLNWALATTMLFTTFAPMMITLGAMGLISAVIGFFGGPDPFELAKNMLTQIASTIVDVSLILSGGNWTQGPNEDWAKGVSLAIGAFAPVFTYLQQSGIYSVLFGSDAMKPEQYSETMRSIGYAIIDIANVFNEGKIDKWEGGPSKTWAEGVGAAIGAFAPIFGILSGGGIMSAILGGPSMDDMRNAITMISESIKMAALTFSDDTGVYRGGPTKKWSEGVGAAISAFAGIYEWVFDGIDWTPDNISDGNKVIFKMARSILYISKIFQGYDYIDGELVKGERTRWNKFPSTKWSNGVVGALKGFGSIYQWAYDKKWDVSYIDEYTPVIYKIADSIKIVGNKLSSMSDIKLPGSNFTKDLGKNIKNWGSVINSVEDMNTDGIFSATARIMLLAEGFNSLSESLNNLSTSINGFNPEFISVLAEVSGVDVEIKSDVEKTDSEQASWWDTILGGSDKDKEEKSISVPTMTAEKEDMTITDIYQKLDELNQQLQIIANNSNNMSQYVDELRSSTQGVNIGM